jgi:cytochrome c oxidase cbb3-type subunit 3
MKTIIAAGLFILCFAISVFGNSIDAQFSPSKTDSFSISNGQKVFATHCAGCHGANGQGSFGPNLCDEYWIHGGHYHNIVHVIKHGATTKGMTSFKHKLTHAQVRDVAHYIMISLKGSKPKNAKGPEGKKHVHQ